MKYFCRITGTCFLVFAVGALSFLFVPQTIIYLDNKFLDEYIRSLYGRRIEGEDWFNLPVLPNNMDYRWLAVQNKPLRIGHALGFSGTSLANQLDALLQTSKYGLHVLEVDLWLAEDGSVRCFHGPGNPGPLLDKTCTFDRLIQATELSEEYLVLDIKTNFAQTAMKIDRILDRFHESRQRVIFQLYSPSDVETFFKLSNLTSYAGPIVTAYKSRSSLNDVAQGAKRAGIRAFTFPVQRQNALNRQMVSGLHLYVHPVHECVDMQQADKNAYHGFYTLAFLKC